MDFAEIAKILKVTELAASSRSAVIRHLAQAAQLEDEGLTVDSLTSAIEVREAAAQTVVARGFAVPHAVTNWDGDFRVVLGRSRQGIEYGTADTGLVYLVILLVIGTRGKARHLELLAALAEFFAEEAFRAQLIAAKDSRSIRRLVREKAGLVGSLKKEPPKLPPINKIMVRQAIEIVRRISAQAILVATDRHQFVPWKMFEDWDGRLLVVSPEAFSEGNPAGRDDTHLIEVPHVSLSRTDRANLGLLLSAAKRLVKSDSDVVCVTGTGGPQLDSICVIRPESHFENMFGLQRPGRTEALPAVILRAVAIALELAEQGREGKAVGTMFVIGDSRHVLKHTQQLVLNPFHGYSRNLRSILDPSLRETIKEFALLDGAFVVQADGIVLSAATYVIPMAGSPELPGLGTRHQAAASITANTNAMAIVVSQSTGTVVAFRQGKVVLKLERSGAVRH